MDINKGELNREPLVFMKYPRYSFHYARQKDPEAWLNARGGNGIPLSLHFQLSQNIFPGKEQDCGLVLPEAKWRLSGGKIRGYIGKGSKMRIIHLGQTSLPTSLQ